MCTGHLYRNSLLRTKFPQHRMSFTEIWWFNYFQNGGHPPFLIFKIGSLSCVALVCHFTSLYSQTICRWVMTKNDFQHDGSPQSWILNNLFFITWLSLCSISAVVYQILSKSDDFSLRYGDLAISKMAAVHHLGFVMTSQYCIVGHTFIVLKFVVDRCCSFRDTCNIISRPFGCT